MVGSLYVHDIDDDPDAIALFTPSSGERVFCRMLSKLACEICQFWQWLQEKLHPTPPREYESVPGRKWYSGFFSMGSTASDETLP